MTDAPNQPYNPDPRAHPGLHAIAVIEAIKGALAVLAASGLELLGPAPLQRGANELITRFQLDPDHGAMAWLAKAINPHSVHLAAGAHSPTACCICWKAGACGAPRPGHRGWDASRPRCT